MEIGYLRVRQYLPQDWVGRAASQETTKCLSGLLRIHRPMISFSRQDRSSSLIPNTIASLEVNNGRRNYFRIPVERNVFWLYCLPCSDKSTAQCGLQTGSPVEYRDAKAGGPKTSERSVTASSGNRPFSWRPSHLMHCDYFGWLL